MRKIAILLILTLTILLSNFTAALNTTNPISITNSTNTITTTNPITAFMQKETSSGLFKFIGTPEMLTHQRLIIYLLFILVAYILITDVLSATDLFDKKWISNAISLIIILLGTYSGTSYKLITSLLDIEFKSIFITTAFYYILLGIIIGYLFLRTFIKTIKRNNRTNEEKIEERAEKIKALKKIQDIEARAAGI